MNRVKEFIYVLIYFIVLFLLVAYTSNAQQVIFIQQRPRVSTHCKAFSIEAKGGYPATWLAACKVAVDDEVIFGDDKNEEGMKLLPLAIPAKRKEALKAIDNFMEHRVKQLVKEYTERKSKER